MYSKENVSHPSNRYAPYKYIHWAPKKQTASMSRRSFIKNSSVARELFPKNRLSTRTQNKVQCKYSHFQKSSPEYGTLRTMEEIIATEALVNLSSIEDSPECYICHKLFQWPSKAKSQLERKICVKCENRTILLFGVIIIN
jgi:hypothetical protein